MSGNITLSENISLLVQEAQAHATMKEQDRCAGLLVDMLQPETGPDFGMMTAEQRGSVRAFNRVILAIIDKIRNDDGGKNGIQRLGG